MTVCCPRGAAATKPTRRCGGKDLFYSRLAEDLDQRAAHTADDAECVIGHTLLMLWGLVRSYEEARNNTDLAPWKPVGALVEGRWFCWITPADHRGKPDYQADKVRVRVIDGEDLEEDGLSDADWDRLLERPPCPVCRLERYEASGGYRSGVPRLALMP